MDDQILLSQYVTKGDSAAFEELTRRYAGLVKCVCQRVLGNSHDAEEVAQECFLELARDAKHVHSSVAGWLHRAATTRSINALRSRSRRKVRERAVGVTIETASALTDATTIELRRVIDGVLTAMPDELRLPMVLHFLDGRSQRDVALELGVNQSTISRRMRDALRQLRERLTQAGYAASVPTIMMAMQNQADAVPDSTLITVAAVGAAGKAAGSTTIASTIKGTATAALPVLSFFLFGGWFSLLIAVSVAVYVARFRPIWISDIFSSLGVKDVYDQPTFFLSKWNWDQAPRNWVVQVQTSIAWSIVFLGLSAVFAIGTSQPPWGIVILGAVTSTGFLVHAARIIHRVKRIGASPLSHAGDWLIFPAKNNGLTTRVTPPKVCSSGKCACPPPLGQSNPGFWAQIIGFSSSDPTLTWFDAIQLMAIGLIALLIVGQVVIRPQTSDPWPSVVLSGIIGTGMLAWGSCAGRRLLARSRNPVVETPTPPESAARWHSMRTVLAIGAGTVSTLTIWILWNPAAVRGIAISLAAVQTCMLGWIVSRLAASCQWVELKYVRRGVIAVLVGCLILNSSVCLANWLR